MGCYRYCDRKGCDMGLDEPTSREDLIDGQFCVNGHKQMHKSKSIEEWIVDIDERLKSLLT